MVSQVWQTRHTLVPCQLWTNKIRHRDSGRSIGQDHFKNHDQHCTNKANRPDQNWICHFSLRRAQDAHLAFHQNYNEAIFVSQYAGKRPGQRGHFRMWSFARKESQTFTTPEAPPSDRMHLCISSLPEELHLQNETDEKPPRISRLMKQILKSPITSTILDQEYTEESITTLHHANIHNCHSLQHGDLERHGIWKSEDRIYSQNMLQTSKTKRDILYLLKHASKHYRRNQETNRAPDQQSIHHCTLLEFQSAWKNIQKKKTSWTLLKNTKTVEKKRLLGLRYLEDEQYRMRLP